jgi:hypothetical protein
VTPLANASGAATITVFVYDKQWTVVRSFTVTVSPVDDAPEITNLSDQTTEINAPTLPQVFGLSDVDDDVNGLSLTGTSSNPGLVPDGNITFAGSGGERTVTVTPAAGLTGSALITVTVSDGSSTAASAFTVTVNGCNTACLRSTAVGMQSRFNSVTGRVTVRDENGTVVPGARVSVTWTRPDGSTESQTRTTNTAGVVLFSVSALDPGTYTITITNITKSGYTFDAAHSILSRSFVKATLEAR